MAIPPVLRDRLSDPQLWEAFFFDVEDSETVPDVVVEFEVGDGPAWAGTIWPTGTRTRCAGTSWS